ncbi:MAG: hypothetical protein BGO67_02835 [Alphaproteobacteria bacterium 41-28]|nr:MAG: hypothetical protein BGO67_02835 [Alphaproteobacteria bacterium 41-28]
MATPLWPLCRLTLLITFLWMILACLALMRESYGAKILHTTRKVGHSINQQTSFNINNCSAHIEHYEKHHGIPPGLLHAISKVESGRKDDTGRVIAWPWTVNAEGQGYHFPTKEAAIAAVREMQLNGISSIDVGCMQVNLYHHPHAFKSLLDAFDPAKNVAYAAHFLKGLKNEHASWSRAVAHYHSANPIHHIPYHKNVMRVWNREMKAGGVVLAAGIFEEETRKNVNRIHRLENIKTLSLKRASYTTAAHKSAVRRIVGSNSRHIHRVHSMSHRKTLKIS